MRVVANRPVLTPHTPPPHTEHNSIIPYPKVNQKKLEGEAVSIQPAGTLLSP
jgi:hypothetical protein